MTSKQKFIKDEIAPLSKLKPHPKNPRKHSEDYIKRIERSIETFDKTNPIIITPDYTIVAGHARLIAAQNLGLTEFPVRIFDFTPGEAEAYMIADNKLAEGSEWDMVLLEKDILELKSFNMDIESTGFSEKDLNDLLIGVDFGSPDFDLNESLQDESKAVIVRCPQCGEEFEVNRETRL